MSFWGELRRRNVVKVGVAYAIVAWLLIQGADIVSPHLRLPEWTVPLVIILLCIGFPLALLFAWAFEITPDGIKLTKEVPRPESITHLTGQKFNYIVTGLLVLAVGFLAVKVFFLDKGVKMTDVVSTETGQVPEVSDIAKAKKTIAVLPFTDLSPEKDQEYFVDGLSEELLNTLTKIPDLLVTARTSSFAFKGKDKTIQDIAEVLGVAHILEGSVRKAGNALRITAQLVRAADGFHLWSETYDRELKDIFAVQEDIATAVAGELSETLGIERSFRPLGGTTNEEAYEYYLVAKGKANSLIGPPQLEPGGSNLWAESLELVEAALAIDPKFALAWALKANAHIAFADVSNPDSVVSHLNAALEAAQKAIEFEPNLADAHLMLGAYRRVKGDWIEAELEYRKAMELTNEPLWNYTEYWLHYSVVGNYKRSRELLKVAVQNDPLNQAQRRSYIWSLFLSGDITRAEEENERAKALLGEKWDDLTGSFYFALGDKVSSDEFLGENPLVDNLVKKHLNSPKEGIAELRRIYNSTEGVNRLNLPSISIWASYFGDPEFAMDVIEKGRSLHPQIFNVWYPVMHEVRQLPRFKEFVREIGLVDYWNEFGWPDLCRPLDNGDFECD